MKGVLRTHCRHGPPPQPPYVDQPKPLVKGLDSRGIVFDLLGLDLPVVVDQQEPLAAAYSLAKLACQVVERKLPTTPWGIVGSFFLGGR